MPSWLRRLLRRDDQATASSSIDVRDDPQTAAEGGPVGDPRTKVVPPTVDSIEMGFFAYELALSKRRVEKPDEENR